MKHSLPDGEVHVGHVLDSLAAMPAESVQTCITSPPYWGLRKYAGEQVTAWSDGEWAYGLEDTPERWADHTAEWMRAVRRVLRKDGTVWLNCGDSYAGNHTSYGEGDRWQHGGDSSHTAMRDVSRNAYAGYKPLDLIHTPSLLISRLLADGWFLRSVIVWAKPNPMPESVSGWTWQRHQKRSWEYNEKTNELRRDRQNGRDFGVPNVTDCEGCATCARNDGLVLRRGSGRPTDAYEVIILLAKSPNYYYDSYGYREPSSETVHPMQGNQAARDVLSMETLEGWSGGLVQDMPYRIRTDGTVATSNDSLRPFGSGEGETSTVSGDSPRGSPSQVEGLATVGTRAGTPQVAGVEATRQGSLDSVLAERQGQAGQANEGSTLQDLGEWPHGGLEVEREAPPLEDGRGDADASGVAGDSTEAQEPLLLLRQNGEDDNRPPNSSQQRRESQQGQRGASVSSVQREERRQDDAASATRNLRNVWVFPTAPFPLAHFATFPPELVRRAILLSTPDAGCCSVCGAPWARVIETSRHLEDGRNSLGLGDKTSGIQSLAATALHHVTESQTIGWRPTCSHDAPAQPSLVLDPFSGSGTTGVVARSLGRRFVLCELSDSYVQMALKRLTRTQPAMVMA